MRVALYQPEIAGNVGAIIRLCACLGVALDIIEPCGFAYSDRALKRAGMDYRHAAIVTRHMDWTSFKASVTGRVILMTTKGAIPLTQVAFAADDVLLFGQESAGAPEQIHSECDLRAVIPLVPDVRSLNLAVTAGIALHEALRQTGNLPQ
jgi:tRNA (cytidine/uridine-2'-O-)-methyltransferase